MLLLLPCNMRRYTFVNTHNAGCFGAINRVLAGKGNGAGLPRLLNLGSLMSVLRASVFFAGIVACLMFSGLGLYSVNATGQAEAVVDGYAVIVADK
jgi:hypothetical protein